MRTLYIVDGESSAGSLRAAISGAEILVWRDALYDGPVPGGRAHSFDEVVLWFGPTMVCQLSLIQLLDRFYENPAGNLTLIDREYAGWLPPEKIAAPLARRRPVTKRIYVIARRAWKAFTARDPSPLKRFVASDSTALAGLRPILQRVLEEYPDARGLSRIEAKLLGQFKAPCRAMQGVAAAMREETFGDTYYLDRLDRFIGATNQLLCFADPPPANLRASILVATAFGRKVLAGKADAIAFNGIDRWIGGVHLHGDRVPRR